MQDQSELLAPRPLKPQEGSSSRNSRGGRGGGSGSAVDVGALLAGAPAVGGADWCEELQAIFRGFVLGNAGEAIVHEHPGLGGKWMQKQHEQRRQHSRGGRKGGNGSAVDVGSLLAGAPGVGGEDWCEELQAVYRGFVLGTAGEAGWHQHLGVIGRVTGTQQQVLQKWQEALRWQYLMENLRCIDAAGGCEEQAVFGDGPVLDSADETTVW